MRSSKSRSRSKSNRQRSPMGNIVNRVFDSSGPEGKVRGTPQQIIDKYQGLARDAQLSNDRVAAENFLQHSEHYARMLSEAQREMDAQRQHQQGSSDQPRQDNDRDDSGNDGRNDNRNDGRQDSRSERQNEPRHDPRGDDRSGGRNDRTGDQRSDSQGSGSQGGGGPRGGAQDGDSPSGRSENRRPQRRERRPAQADVIDVADEAGSGLVDTPETRGKPAAEHAPDAGAQPPRPRRARKPKPADEGSTSDAAPGHPSEAAE